MTKKDVVGIIVCLAICVLIAFLVAGCNGGIWADARHATLLDNTAGWAESVRVVSMLPNKCESCVGAFSREEVISILQSNAKLWLYFDQAKDARPVGPMPEVPAY